jgi:hypothetical protein
MVEDMNLWIRLFRMLSTWLTLSVGSLASTRSEQDR